jgi:hypothetical protein
MQLLGWGEAQKLVIVSVWATFTKGTEWLISVHLVKNHGSGQNNYFYNFLDLIVSFLPSSDGKVDHR